VVKDDQELVPVLAQLAVVNALTVDKMCELFYESFVGIIENMGGTKYYDRYFLHARCFSVRC